MALYRNEIQVSLIVSWRERIPADARIELSADGSRLLASTFIGGDTVVETEPLFINSALFSTSKPSFPLADREKSRPRDQ